MKSKICIIKIKGDEYRIALTPSDCKSVKDIEFVEVDENYTPEIHNTKMERYCKEHGIKMFDYNKDREYH